MGRHSSAMRAHEAVLDEQFLSVMSSIQRSFSCEVAEVLTRATTDAKIRRHPDVTPLHVAAALLSSPPSLLRRACTIHQQQQFLPCGTLNLCFKDALDRILTPMSSLLSVPSFSSTLKACLQRAQSTQIPSSPGCPLNLTQINLSLLTVSILDDPLVSSVMSEAGIPSSRIKQSILTYMNSRKIRGQEIVHAVSDYRQQIKRVEDVIMRQQKRNLVVVGDHLGVDFFMEDVRGMLRRGEFGDLNVVSVGDLLSRTKTSELHLEIRGIINITSLEVGKGKGVILDLGDLKWLVDDECKTISQPNRTKHTMDVNRQSLIETVRVVIAEMGAIVRHERRIWVIGTASYATYLKCQIYHPNMEKDWDLHVIQFSPRWLVGVSSSFGRKEILESYAEVLNTSNGFTSCSNNHIVHHNRDLENVTLCSTCLKQHDEELFIIQGEQQLEQVNDGGVLNGLQHGSMSSQREENLNNKIVKLCKKWHATCLRLHYQLEVVPPLLQATCSSSHILPHSVLVNQVNASSPLASSSAAGSYSGTTSTSDFQIRVSKGLMWEVNWQPEAAMSIVSAILDVKSGSSKRCGNEKSDTWLLFNGSDYLGKRKMADALSNLVFGTASAPLNFNMSRDYSSGGPAGHRPCGRALLDLLVGVVKANPLQVVVLDGIDQADSVIMTTIRHSMMTGLLVDSNFRVVGSLSNTIFVLIVGGKEAAKEVTWHLELSVRSKTDTRRDVESEQGNEARNKSKMVSHPFSLDLTLHVGSSSDVDNYGNDNAGSVMMTADRSTGQLSRLFPPNIGDIYHFVDGVVDFNPFDLNQVKHVILQVLLTKFSAVMGATLSMEVEMCVVDHLAEVFWYEYGGIPTFEKWADVAFVPAVEQLRSRGGVKDGDKINLTLENGRGPTWMSASNWAHLVKVSVNVVANAI